MKIKRLVYSAIVFVFVSSIIYSTIPILFNNFAKTEGGNEIYEFDNHYLNQLPESSDVQPIPHGEFRELALNYLPIMKIDEECDFRPSIIDPNDNGNANDDRDDYQNDPYVDTTPTVYIQIDVNDEIEITYWFYYVYNDYPSGIDWDAVDHESDWERIKLYFPLGSNRFSSPTEAKNYYHGHSSTSPWWMYPQSSGRPLVYVINDGHGSYRSENGDTWMEEVETPLGTIYVPMTDCWIENMGSDWDPYTIDFSDYLDHVFFIYKAYDWSESNCGSLFIYTGDSDIPFYDTYPETDDPKSPWERWSGGVEYGIPSINHPYDITYAEGTTGHEVTWETFDYNPSSYYVTLDTVVISSGNWYAEPITVNVDGLSPGLHILTCTVYDIVGNKRDDIVLIRVTEFEYIRLMGLGMQSLAKRFNFGVQPYLITGVRFCYNDIEDEDYGTPGRQLDVLLEGDSYSTMFSEYIPLVDDDTWMSMYIKDSNYLIDNDPWIEMIGYGHYWDCITICGKTPSDGNSYYNYYEGGWTLDPNYEYMIYPIYEEMGYLSLEETTYDIISSADNVNAYIITLESGVNYIVDLEQITGTGSLDLSVARYEEVPNDYVILETGTDNPKSKIFSPSVSGTYVLFVESTNFGESDAAYSISLSTVDLPLPDNLYKWNFDDEVEETRIPICDPSITPNWVLGGQLAVNFNTEGKLSLIKGVSYRYSADGNPYYPSVLDRIYLQFKGDSSSNSYEIRLPNTEDSWKSHYLGTTTYLIDDDPEIIFGSPHYYFGCPYLFADTPSYGYSYYNNGEGWTIDTEHEYMVKLIYEYVEEMDCELPKLGSMTAADKIDAYLINLEFGYDYNFSIERMSGFADLSIKMVMYQDFTNEILAQSSGINNPKYMSFIPSSTDTYILLVESDGAGSEDTTYNLECVKKPVNHAPVANDDSYYVDEDNELIISAPGVQDNDNDVDGDALTITLITDTEHGSLILNPEGSFTYTPDLNYNGVDSFTYVVNDGLLDSNLATVTITINPVNDAPVASDDAYSVDEDTELVIPVPGVLDNDLDIDGDNLMVSLITDSDHGILILNPDGTFTYTPDLNYNGIDSFEYIASDGSAESNTATVIITINAVNDAPVANDDSAITDEDTDVVIDVLSNDSDIDGDIIYIDNIWGPTSGIVIINLDGTITYSPELDFVGMDSFKYRILDGQGGTDTATCVVQVLDKTPPTTTIDLEGTLGNNNWFISNVIITLNAEDAYSGISLTEYTTDGINWIVYTTSFTITSEGIHNIKYRSIDGVGNIEPIKEKQIKIDKTAPITTLTKGYPNNGSNPTFISTNTKFVLEALDNEFGSEIERIEYRIASDIDPGEWLTYDTSFNINNLGTHFVYYRSIDKAGNQETENCVWVIVNASKLTYIGNISGNYSDPVLLEAKLIDCATEFPIEGKTITFIIGDQTIPAVTLSDGIARANIILDQPGGSYTVSASFTEDEQYLGSSDTSNFIIEKEYAHAIYTGSTIIPVTVDTITLRATVFDDIDGNWGDLTKIKVTFKIYTIPMDPNNLIIYGPYIVEVTNVDGVGVVIVDIPNLPDESYLVQICFNPSDNDYYQGPVSDLVIITVYEPSGEFVTGGGWIIDSNGNKGNFGFNVKYKKNGLPKGQATYVYREGDWEYLVKSNAWEGLAIDGTHAFFEAKCVVQQYNSKTGELYWSEGNYRLRIDVWDEDKDGGMDVFQIRIYDKIGLIYYEAGFEPYGYLLGGNIVIHTDKEK